MSVYDPSWSLYPYEPSKSLPIVFAVFIVALGGALGYQSFFLSKWYHFGYVCTVATCIWVAGFICRAISAYNIRNVSVFIAQNVLVLAGPPAFASSEYLILGRILTYVPYHAPLHPGRVLSTFYLLSAFVEALSASGAANSAGSSSKSGKNIGQACIQAALILQAAIELAFCTLTAFVHYKYNRSRRCHASFPILFIMLYVTSLMILVRCVVRIAEEFENGHCPPQRSHCGVVSQHEYYFWVFEVGNITIFVALLAALHPGGFLPANDKVYLDPIDGKTERLGPGFIDKRRFLWTVVDPFDILGRLTGRGRQIDHFWQREHPVYEQNTFRGKTMINGQKFSSSAKQVQ